ncbi:hypothetical protein ABES58_09885 [Paenibacillus lautus]|uniref:hypothetical protein n=1 Tax=Paenibacillus lautus TaxID=1401 RepID=UPI003D273866
MNVLNEVEASSLYLSYLFSTPSSDQNLMYSLVKRLRVLQTDSDLIDQSICTVIRINQC